MAFFCSTVQRRLRWLLLRISTMTMGTFSFWFECKHYNLHYNLFPV